MKRFILYIISLSSMLFVHTSCVKDGEYLDDCRQYINFVYDYNMSYVDLFSKQATKMNLFIFDQSGKYVTTLSDQQTSFPNNYKMLIPDNLPEGKYQVVAWSGLYDDSYTLASLTVGQSTLNDLLVKIKNYETAHVDFELKPLWHGIQDIEVNRRKDNVQTVSLVKDTKKFRIVLQDLAEGKTVDVNNYDFEITAANAIYDYQNTPSGNTILYTPYYTYTDPVAGGVVEINTMRLIDGTPKRLVITKKNTGEKIVDISLDKYLAALRLQAFNYIPAQEYLDREDSFAMLFFFKDIEDSHLGFSIKINGWLIREQGSEI